ncbi:hypothetical protein TNCV_4419791 [Trichonephila clavipes]|nr:hypothetical protein TNCV_4419791 [Trichonephila clavipes]
MAYYYGTTLQNVINCSYRDCKTLRDFLGLVRSAALDIADDKLVSSTEFISKDVDASVKDVVRTLLRVLEAALWDKKLAFRTHERRKFWVFTDGPQRREKKTSSEAMLQLNSASKKKSVLLKEDQTDL